MTTATQVPEIERAAATILAQANPQHPILREWVKNITSDPAYDESFLSFEPSVDTVHEAEQQGLAARKGKYDMFRNGAIMTAILNARDPSGKGEGIRKLEALKDAAILRLAGELCAYRHEGRPSGDVTRPIQGMGGPIALVQTSLAAAVAEYVKDITDAAFNVMPWED